MRIIGKSEEVRVEIVFEGKQYKGIEAKLPEDALNELKEMFEFYFSQEHHIPGEWNLSAYSPENAVYVLQEIFKLEVSGYTSDDTDKEGVVH